MKVLRQGDRRVSDKEALEGTGPAEGVLEGVA